MKKEYIDNVSYSPDTLTPELKKKLLNIFSMKNKAEIVSKKAKYSNCYFEAFKRKLKNPFIIRIIPIINKNTYIRRFLFNKVELHTPPIFHFWWSDGHYDYNFTNYNERKHSGIKDNKKDKRIKIPFIIYGVIEKYPLGYAELQNDFFAEYYRFNNDNKKWLSISLKSK